MSEQAATIWAAIILVVGSILIALVSGMLAWMFFVVRRISEIETRVRGIGQQLRLVPKRSTDRGNNEHEN
jgi:hypothetical protein